MKILTNKRYNDLVEKVNSQAIKIDLLEETNNVARSKYHELIIECANKDNIINQLALKSEQLQKTISSLQRQVWKLSQENRHLEAEIERSTKRF